MTEGQKARIRRLTSQGGLNHEDVLDLAEEVTGNSVTSLDDLDTSDASHLIDRLEDGRL